MRIFISGYTSEESGVSEILYEISEPAEKFFKAKRYGTGLKGLAIFLMCWEPQFNRKRLALFSRKESTLYITVILDLKQMTRLRHRSRKREVAKRLSIQVPAIMDRYAFPNFATERFNEDWKRWVATRVAPAPK